MNSSRLAQAPAQDPAPPVALPQGLFASWGDFWFAPRDPIGLHALRLLVGLLFLAWLLPLAGQQDALFGMNGWFDARAYKEASHIQGLPPHVFSWSILYACGSNPTLLGLAYWLSVAAVVLFTLGVYPRVTALLAYVVAVSFTANPAIAYDADPLLVMLSFYVMLGYLFLGLRRPGQSWLARLLGPRDSWFFRGFTTPEGNNPVPSVAANLAVRLIQVHFAIVMLASALYKLQIREWWSGLAPWFYLHQPFQTTVGEVRSLAPNAFAYLVVLSAISYAALAWQLAFPVYAWRPRWRPLLLTGAVLAWVADAFFLRLPLIGPIMVIGCLSYLTPVEWRRTARWIGQAPRLGAMLGRSNRAPKSSAPAEPKGEAKAEEKISAITVGHSR